MWFSCRNETGFTARFSSNGLVKAVTHFAAIHASTARACGENADADSGYCRNVIPPNTSAYAKVSFQVQLCV
jgi:hypothetical protein